MTQVTATVRDPNGNLYVGGKVEAIFVNNTGLTQLPLASGSVFSTFTFNTIDSFGQVGLSVTGNDLITPAGTQWRFSVISATTPVVGFSVNITITGTTQDISAALQAAAAPLPNTSFGNISTGSITATGNITTTANISATGSITGGSLVTTGNAVIGGGDPHFDVTSSVFGANTCTGSGHDDTPAFLAAATAANNVGGGTVLIPATASGCFWNTALVITSFTNVRFKGTGGPTWFGTGLAPKITCTVSGAGNCMTALGTFGIEIDHVNILYNNAGFTGSLLNFGLNGGIASQGIHLHDMGLQGSGQTGASQLVNLNGSDIVKIDNVQFHNAVNGINGQSATAVRVKSSTFSTATGTLSNAAIKTIGNNWNVIDNVFELGAALGNISIIDCSVACGSNLQFTGNWAGDAPATYNATVFKAMGTGGGGSYNFYGNTIAGGANNSAKLWQNAGGFSDFVFMGNFVSNFSTAFQIDASIVDAVVGANLWGTITTFLTGSVGAFSSGSIFDNAGNTTIRGPMLFNIAPAPLAAGGVDVGTSALPFSGIRIGAAGTNNIRVTGTATAARTATLQDATGTVALTTGTAMITFGCSGTATAGTTLFMGANNLGPATCTDTTGNVHYRIASSGTIRNLVCASVTGGVNGSSGVVTVRKSGADQALTCTFGTTTSCSDTNQAHNFSVLATDAVAIKYTTQAAETLANITCTLEKF